MPSDFIPAPLEAVPTESGWIIDCDACTVRGDACHDCVVSVMLGGPPETPIEPDAHRALTVLADAGLVPPLQMTPAGEDERPSGGRPGAPGNDTA